MENVISTCNQRELYLNFRKPGPRVEIVSPYPTFTQAQLDMRRKVEILKYKQQTLNSNVSSKSKRWSRIVQLSHKNPLSGTKNPCPQDALIPTPTSSCNVPGPIMLLQYNPSVALYKYGYNPSNYNLVDPLGNTLWDTVPINDVEFPQGTSVALCNLVLQHPINSYYSYQFQMPLSIYFSGYKDLSSDAKTVSFISIALYTANCEIRYNNLIVPNVRPIVNPSVNTILLSVTNSNNGYFEAARYIGPVYVSNIVLPTQPQYVYNFDMTFQIKYTLLDELNQPIQELSDVSQIQTLTIGNLTGPSDHYYNQTNNCTLVNDYPNKFYPFELTGV
jgi:hypothetical protein